MKSRIFISAVTGELKSAREIVANTLFRRGHQYESREIMGNEAGDLKQMLRERIDSCNGLIHIVGSAYGFAPWDPDPEFGRVSYTQYELLYARKTKKPNRVWVLMLSENFQPDQPIATLDLPASSHRKPAVFQAKRRRLQADWRKRIAKQNDLWYPVSNKVELELAIYKIDDELARLRRVARYCRFGLFVGFAAICLMFAGIWSQLQQQSSNVNRIEEQLSERDQSHAQQLKSARETLRPEEIKIALLHLIEQTHTKQIAQADALPDWKKRTEAKRDAAAARDQCIREIDIYLDSISNSIRAGDVSSEQLEFIRIIQEQGPDEALKYIGRVAARLYEEASRLTARKRQKLAPILGAARLCESRGEYDEARAHCEKLLALDPDWTDVLHQHWSVLSNIGDWFQNYGRIENALNSHEAAEFTARRCSILNPSDASLQRAWMISLNKLGDVANAMGRPADAWTRFEEALAITRRLAEASPTDPEAQRDVWVSLAKLNVLAIRYGNAAANLAKSEELLKTSRLSAESDPKNPVKQRDLRASLEIVADVLLRCGRAKSAREHCEEALKIARAAVGIDPNNVVTNRELADSINRLGLVMTKLSLWGEAYRAHGESLAIGRRLAAEQPGEAEIQKNIKLSLDCTGDLLLILGSPDLALERFSESCKLARSLSDADPEDSFKLRDLLIASNNCGKAELACGNPNSAHAKFTESLRICKTLTRNDPNDLMIRRDMANTLFWIGESSFVLGQNTTASQSFSESLKLKIALIDSDKSDSDLRRDLMVSYCKLGEIYFEYRKYPIALAFFEKAKSVSREMVDSQMFLEPEFRENYYFDSRIGTCKNPGKPFAPR